MQLRPYQRDAVEALRDAFRAGCRAPLLVAPTGAGKTVMFAAVAAGALEKRRRVLIVAHRAELIAQASQKLHATGVAHGIIAPGFPHRAEPVQVGSIQTLGRRLDRLADYDLIVLDEAHHAIAGSWRALLAAQPGAKILGVTATPERMDGRGLGDVFDRIVLGPSVPALIAGDYLVGTRTFAAEHQANLTGIKIVRGDYEQRELVARMDTREVTGDAEAHYRRHAAGLPAIAFCANVQHAQDVAASFRAAGWRAEAAFGDMPPGERKRVLSGLADGSVQVVCAADLISEGIDVPVVGAVILLRPTQSLGLHLQQIGRGLRPAPGKSALIVLDHAGNTQRHGFAEGPRVWSLAGRGKKAPPPVAIRQCPQCYAVHAPAPRCPVCERRYGDGNAARGAPPARAGELIELDQASAEMIRAASMSELIAAAKTRAHLRLIAQTRGYHPRWVDRQIQMRPRFQRATA